MPQKDRLSELDAQREKIIAKSAPMRAELDDLVKSTMSKEQKLRERIIAAEKDLYDIDVERAGLLRIRRPA